jgi:hypothetical protein
MNPWLLLLQAWGEIVAGALTSTQFYPFFAVQFCIGATAGISARKDRESAFLWFMLALLLGFAAVVELVIVGELRRIGEGDADIAKRVLSVVSFFILFWFFWVVCLFFNSVGYWATFFVSWRLDYGRGQLSLGALLLIVTLFALVAAMAMRTSQ